MVKHLTLSKKKERFHCAKYNSISRIFLKDSSSHHLKKIHHLSSGLEICSNVSILQFTIIVTQMRLTKSKYKIITNKGERSYPWSLITRLKTGFCWRVHLMPLLINYIGSLRANKPRIWATVLSVAFVTTGRTSSERKNMLSASIICYLFVFLFRIINNRFSLINWRTCLFELHKNARNRSSLVVISLYNCVIDMKTCERV